MAANDPTMQGTMASAATVMTCFPRIIQSSAARLEFHPWSIMRFHEILLAISNDINWTTKWLYEITDHKKNLEKISDLIVITVPAGGEPTKIVANVITFEM